MIVLNVSELSQIISFIPRDENYDTLELTDEQTNDTTEVEILDSVVGEYYHTIEGIFDLVENHFYMLVLKNGSDIVFKDKVFCTNQPLVSFSVNNGQYVSSTTTNDFIIYE
jgi:hypothetical protein